MVFYLRSFDGGNVLQRFQRWNGTDTLLLLDYNNNLQQFYCWNGTIRPACLPAGAIAGQARCARGGRVPVEEPCTRRPEGGKPAVIPPSGLSLFPHGACLIGGFTIQWMKGRVVVIQVVRTTGKTLSYMNFAAVGAVFFVSVTGYVTAISETEFRSARWTRGLMNCGS